MKSTILCVYASALLTGTSALAANPPPVKAGTIATVNLKVTVTSEKPLVTQTLPQGVKRKISSTTSVKLLSRDILEAMRVANLLDGNLKGWSLSRLANLNDVGNLYATKAGKTAVAVPATLLTQTVVQGSAATGTVTVPATGPENGKLKVQSYATLTVRGGASSGLGNQGITKSQVKVNNVNTAVTLRSETYNIFGRGSSTSATSVLSGSYATSQSVAVNLASLLPGDAAP